MRRVKCRYCPQYLPKWIDGKMVEDVKSHTEKHHPEELEEEK